MNATANADHEPPYGQHAVRRFAGGTITGAKASFLTLVAYALSIAVLLYIFTFNFHPTEYRLAFAAMITAGYGALFVLAIDGRKPGPILCIVGLLGMTMVEYFNGSAADAEVGFAVIRQFSSLIGYAAFLLVAPLVLSARQLTGLGLVLCACVVLVVFQVFYHEPVEVRGAYRVGSVTGGLDLMHPSAYAVAALTLMCGFFAFTRKFNPRLGQTMLPFWAVLAFLLLILLEGIGVRTIFLMLASFLFFYLIFSPRNRTLITWAVPIVLLLFLFLAVYVVDKSFWLSNVEVGSGRVGAYVQRLEIFGARGFQERIMGSGIGSDYFYGKYQWRHGEKDSHNDYLSMLIELGVLGVGFFALYAAGLFMMSKDRITFSMTCMILVASLVSNSALFRPNLGALFAIAALVGRSLWVVHRESLRERVMRRQAALVQRWAQRPQSP